MSRTKRFVAALVLNLVLVAGLAVVGITAHSLAVLAAAADYLADAAAIGIAIVAIRLVARYPRANAVAAAVNAGWLLVLSLVIVAGGIDRLVTGAPSVHGLPVLVMSGVAALLMTVAAVVLGVDMDGDDDDDDDEALSHRAVLLDTAADAAASLGVAAAGAVILASGSWSWLDPAVAVAIAAIFGWHAFVLLRKVHPALLRSAPAEA